MDAQINELEGLTSQHALSDIEFDVMRQLLSVFKSSIDEMTIEQKRSAVRTLVRKVVWDGVNAHVVLFGASDDEIDYPEIGALGGEAGQDEEPNDELVPFGDVNYDDDDQEDNCLGKNKPLSGSKTHWGEDSK
jgi:site-specific DNA recombinase